MAESWWRKAKESKYAQCVEVCQLAEDVIWEPRKLIIGERPASHELGYEHDRLGLLHRAMQRRVGGRTTAPCRR